MKKITVKEAIENGLKVGDEVWIKSKVLEMNESIIPLCLDLGSWVHLDLEIYLPEPEATTEPKLEVGQYWHHYNDNSELVILEDYHSKVTKVGDGWKLELGYESIAPQTFDYLLQQGYILGRHPDNVERVVRTGDVYQTTHCKWKVISKNNERKNTYWCECIESKEESIPEGAKTNITLDDSCVFLYNVNDQPEATPEPEWQPKEGELVWQEQYKRKGKFFVDLKGVFWILWNRENGSLAHQSLCSTSQLEPYTNQDKQIDFGIPEQWLKSGDTIVKTSGKWGKTNGNPYFGAYYLGQFSADYDFSTRDNWELLTPEQIKPLLDAYKALTENQND